MALRTDLCNLCNLYAAMRVANGMNVRYVCEAMLSLFGFPFRFNPRLSKGKELPHSGQRRMGKSPGSSELQYGHEATALNTAYLYIIINALDKREIIFFEI
jgi:hypothetical protein